MSDNSLLIIEPYKLTTIDSGGKQRAFHTIKELSKRYKVEVAYFPPKQKHFFSFLTCGVPYWFSDWSQTTPSIGSADIYLVEYTQLLHLINYLPTSSIKIFTAYDISTISFWRRLEQEKNLTKKILHFFRWLEVYLYERKYVPQYDRVITVSEHDAHELKKIFGIKHVDVIENGIDKIDFLPKRPFDGYLNLGFIGSSAHPPNQQAINFLIHKISPELVKKNIKHKIILAGSNKITGKNVTNLGRVTDIKDFYAHVDLLIAPIFSGSGSRIKILESLSFARPVITTYIGAEGLTIDSNFLIKIDPTVQQLGSEWANTILNTKTNPPSNKKQLRQQLGQLTWENLFQKFRY